MKKIICIILATMLLASVAVFADVPDVTASWTHTMHVSYDEVKPGVVCGGDMNKINYYSGAAGTTEVGFWGWATSDVAEFTGFSYSINGGEKVTDASFIVEAEPAVKDAGQGAYDSRFDVKAAVTDGTQLVRVYANYADGRVEAIWACEVTIGAATEYVDNESAETPDNPTTGDATIVAIVAVATIALAGVAVSKKIHA